MTEKKQTNRKLWIGVIALAAVAVLFVGIFLIFRPKTAIGSKNIVIDVIGKDKSTTTYRLRTDAEYLRGAMEEAEGLTFSGTESEYGMMVETVNGEKADYAVDSSYWGFYVNGEYCNYGIDTQPVYDGDQFEIIYTIYTE